jgi:hypothetical protein
MTQFRFRNKNTMYRYHLNTICSSLIEKLPNAPSSHTWDDFWDFTRMSKPHSRAVLYRRLIFGSSRFVGNYVYIFLFKLVSAGIFGDYRFLAPVIVLTSLWTIICASTEIEDFYRDKRYKEYIISFKNRVSQESNFA